MKHMQHPQGKRKDSFLPLKKLDSGVSCVCVCARTEVLVFVLYMCHVYFVFTEFHNPHL